MKKTLLMLALAVLMLSVESALADDYSPPGWTENDSYTHQEWSFSTGDSVSIPA